MLTLCQKGHMLTPEQIEGFLRKHGDLLFPCPMSDYLDATHRVIWGLLIDPDGRRFHRLFGEITPADMLQFNDRFYSTIAGYRVKARDAFHDLTADADVFLIAKECLEFAPNEVEALVLHELCHWYIDAGLQSSHPIAIDAADRIEAEALYGKTDRHLEHRTKHTLQFCELLCNVAGRAVDASVGCSSRQAVVACAMRFDIEGGFRV